MPINKIRSSDSLVKQQKVKSNGFPGINPGKGKKPDEEPMDSSFHKSTPISSKTIKRSGQGIGPVIDPKRGKKPGEEPVDKNNLTSLKTFNALLKKRKVTDLLPPNNPQANIQSRKKSGCGGCECHCDDREPHTSEPHTSAPHSNDCHQSDCYQCDCNYCDTCDHEGKKTPKSNQKKK